MKERRADYQISSGKMRFKDGIIRVLLLTLLWWLLNAEQNASSWLIGVPVILFAAFLSFKLTPFVSWRWSFAGALHFGLFFLQQSIHGGIDVARRAFDPRLPLNPAFISYPVRLPTVAARVCFMDVISLLPGTLTAELKMDELTIHVLDDNASVRANIQKLEEKVAGLFSLPLALKQGEMS